MRRRADGASPTGPSPGATAPVGQPVPRRSTAAAEAIAPTARTSGVASTTSRRLAARPLHGAELDRTCSTSPSATPTTPTRRRACRVQDAGGARRSGRSRLEPSVDDAAEGRAAHERRCTACGAGAREAHRGLLVEVADRRRRTPHAGASSRRPPTCGAPSEAMARRCWPATSVPSDDASRALDGESAGSRWLDVAYDVATSAEDAGTVEPSAGRVARPDGDGGCGRCSTTCAPGSPPSTGWAVSRRRAVPRPRVADARGAHGRGRRRCDDDDRSADLVAAADALDVEPVGVLGFCMGGMFALKAAGAGRFDRAVAFYGMIRMPEHWRSDADTATPLDALRRRPAPPSGAGDHRHRRPVHAARGRRRARGRRARRSCATRAPSTGSCTTRPARPTGRRRRRRLAPRRRRSCRRRERRPSPVRPGQRARPDRRAAGGW